QVLPQLSNVEFAQRVRMLSLPTAGDGTMDGGAPSAAGGSGTSMNMKKPLLAALAKLLHDGSAYSMGRFLLFRAFLLEHDGCCAAALPAGLHPRGARTRMVTFSAGDLTS
ncbi:unnamed protein product, partial [Amoebophrya sp. A25]